MTDPPRHYIVKIAPHAALPSPSAGLEHALANTGYRAT